MDVAVAYVTWQAVALGQDGSDSEAEPDQIPLEGIKVRLIPSPRKIELDADGGEPAKTITLREWELTTNSNGSLINPESPSQPIAIVASNAYTGVTIEWTSIISTPDTGVADITKTWTADEGTTADLTTVVSVSPNPSNLPAYLQAVADARAAKDIAVSAANRAEDSAYAAGVARTGAETASGIAVAARDEAIPAAASAISARDLAVAARDATLAAVVITGVGRPDVPATLTTPGTAALVAAATSGAEFRSLDGPQGAWTWHKRGSKWVCVEGDTGWLTLATTSDQVLVTANPILLHIRRTDGMVSLAYYSNTRPQSGLSYPNIAAITTLPTGFRPPTSYVSGRMMFTMQNAYNPELPLTTAALSVRETGVVYLYMATEDWSRVQGHLRFSPSDPWPLTLTI